ncbi:MAG: tyrosine-protein kinase family protein [Burkholderiales bacterium]|nr:tyrosine-protein kinase family protein [Burkholderiales bacterium]HQU63458.1 XrtA-associated tyrosine autokinase [Nitrosomonas sp.]
MSIIEKAISKLERAAGNKRTDRVRSQKIQRMTVDAGNTLSKENDVTPNKQSSFIDSVPESVNVEPRNYVVIDLKRLNQLGIVTPDQGKTQIAEQFRIIKRPLLTKAFSKKNNNLIMITSALAGEGKSFCAVNLAMSIASEMDHRVLLIDADVGRPTIPNILGFENKIGLMDILIEDSVDVADVLIKTSIEKLSLISVGAVHPHATELLASQAMLMLLDELAQRYNDRIVIFDSPPVLLTSEARVLAERMGQIVLVVEAERTAQQTLKHVINQFGASSDISLIYNKDRTFSDNKYYGYYYS